MRYVINIIGSFLKLFVSHRRGGVMIVFGLTLIPAIGFAGISIDYARAYRVKSHLQSAADAAALAAASSQVAGQTELKKIAQDIFEANLLANGESIKVTPKITVTDSSVTVSVDTQLSTTLMNVLGIESMDVAARSEVMLPTWIKGEVVLVLDYSSSMDSKGKYQAMRDAAIELVKTLSQNGKNEEVKFALVPFAEHVYGTMESNYIINETSGGTWTNCTSDRKWPFNTQDTTPVLSIDDTKWGLEESGKKKKKKSDPYKDCDEYPNRSLVITSLSDNHQATLAQLTAMYPLSGTHIALGLEFGWHVISPNPPWTDGVAYGDEETVKVIVLLTDGRQSIDGYGPGGSKSESKAENNLETTCEAIKAKEVIMITVGFDLYDGSTLQRLKNCATSDSYFFDAKTNGDLKSAFANITGKISGELRITK